MALKKSGISKEKYLKDIEKVLSIVTKEFNLDGKGYSVVDYKIKKDCRTLTLSNRIFDISVNVYDVEDEEDVNDSGE